MRGYFRQTVLLSLAIFLCGPIFAQQQVTIRILIKDGASGELLANANVTDLSTQAKVLPTDEGDFLIYIGQATREFLVTHIGYENKTVLLGADIPSPVIVNLVPSSNIIEEVPVSTGYQTLPKERATGSFEILDSALIHRSTGYDLLSRLEGVTASMLFSKNNYDLHQYTPRSVTASQIRVRGESSLFTEANPLIILDNFPYDGDISSINPNDVESVTLLKDAAAASIWGAQAGNGVVVVTTKQGRFNEPLRISFSANAGTSDKPDLFHLPILSGAEFIEMERFLFDQGHYNSIENNIRRPALSPAVELFIQHRDGLLDDLQLQQQLTAMGEHDVRQDFLDHVYRQPVQQQYAFSLGGGRDNFNFRTSLGYDHHLQGMQGNRDHRLSLRNEMVFRPNDKLAFQASFQYTQRQAKTQERDGYGQINMGNFDLYPYARLLNDDGTPASIPRDYRIGFVDTAGAGRLLDWHYRPLEDVGDRALRNQDVILQGGITYAILRGLNLGLKYQYQTGKGDLRAVSGMEMYHIRNSINRFTEINGDQLIYHFPFGGEYMISNEHQQTHNGRVQLDFNRGIDSHEFNILGGFDVRQRNINNYRQAVYGFDQNILVFTPVDPTEYYPLYGDLGSATLLPVLPKAFGDITNRYVSAFGNIGYTFLDRYMLSASARKDASNLLGVETNHRWEPLWSVGAAWNVHKEPFFSQNIIDILKVRLTYGYSGNIDHSRSAHTIITHRPLELLAGRSFADISNPPDPSLRWEKVSTLNTGVDFQVLQGRISGTIEAYWKESTDLFGMTPMDWTTGFRSLTTNSANTRGHGIDVTLRALNLESKRFHWNTTFVYSHNQTKLVEYLGADRAASSYIGASTSKTILTDYPLYSVFSYRWKGLDPLNGDPLGWLGGETSKDYNSIRRNSTFDDLVFHGSGIPLHFGSLRNDFAFGNLSLSINFTYRLGYFFRLEGLRYSSSFSNYRAHAEWQQRWVNPGDEQFTNVPSLIYPASSNRDDFYTNSEIRVEKGNHVRLQDIRLGYNLLTSRLQKYRIRGLQVVIYASNLGIVWRANKKGIDPDHIRNIPPPRYYNLGLSFTL